MGPSTLKLLPLFISFLRSAVLANSNIPNSSDLTIKTRRNDSFDSTVETLYFKGSKQSPGIFPRHTVQNEICHYQPVRPAEEDRPE